MAVTNDDVNKMLDDLSATQPAQSGQPTVDPNALLDAATNPNPQPAAAPAAAPAQVDPTRFGQLLNDNADLRQKVERLTAEVTSLQSRAPQPQQTQPQAAQPAQDGGWNQWATTHAAGAVNEVADADWLANPKGATEKVVSTVLARAGREMMNQADRIALTRSYETGTALQLDEQFSQIAPGLMGTEMGQAAVRMAIARVAPDPRFQNLMRSRATRQDAFEIVRRIANAELGRSDEVTAALGGGDQSQVRKSVFAERGAGRPSEQVPFRQSPQPDPQKAALDGMIDAIATGKVNVPS